MAHAYPHVTLGRRSYYNTHISDMLDNAARSMQGVGTEGVKRQVHALRFYRTGGGVTADRQKKKKKMFRPSLYKRDKPPSSQKPLLSIIHLYSCFKKFWHWKF